MQIAKNSFDVAPVNSSGVRLVGSVILYAEKEEVDRWCERNAIGECKRLALPLELCAVLFEPTTRGRNTVEIQYEVGEPIQTATIAHRVAESFSKAIAVA